MTCPFQFMRKVLIYTGVLVVGMMSGWLLGVFGPRPTTWGEARETYLSGAIEQIYIAGQIRLGKGNQLVENVEAQIPGVVTMIAGDEALNDSSNAQSVLWHARQYYERHGVMVPTEIQPIFERLPMDHPIECSLRNGIHSDD